MKNDYCKHARLGVNAQDGRIYLFEPNRNDVTKSKQRRHITNEFVWTFCQFLEIKDKPFKVITDDEVITIEYNKRKLTEEEKGAMLSHMQFPNVQRKLQGATAGK